jgi:SAM-dependent methyltransferase
VSSTGTERHGQNGTGADAIVPTSCAICGPDAAASQMYAANFSLADFTPTLFSARRLPDRIHFRMVRCDRCGLVRSDPVLRADVLAALYSQSTFDYGEELPNLRRTYRRYISRLRRLDDEQDALLEIGCGNGFVLEEAVALGYRRVAGVEPSSDAIQRADPMIRGQIVVDVMRNGLFQPRSFDAICLFQTFDHLPDPAAILDMCRTTLRDGGLLLLLNHDVNAFSARILGERSPIVDIEHTYLFSPKTMRELVEKQCFTVTAQGAVRNTVSVRYLTQLFPLPPGMKQMAGGLIDRARLGRLNLTLPLGNQYLIARNG